MDWISLSGWVMAVVGLLVAGIQTYRTKRLERRNREQLTLFIKDANNVSFEKFAETTRKKYRAVYDAGWELPSLANPVFAHPVAEPLHKLMRFMAKVVINDFGGLLVLVLYGYGVAGVKIARSMFEASVNAAYLRAHPERVDDYIDFHHITKKKFYDHLLKYDLDTAKAISANLVDEMNREYANVEHRFKNKSSWTPVPLADRAEEVGSGQLYRTFYPIASGIIHVDIRALVAHTALLNMDVEPAPSEKWIHESLAMGHNAVVRVMKDYNDAANLGMEKQVEAIYAGFKRAWPSK